MLTEAEAIQRVRHYAEAKQYDFYEPVSVHLERRELQPGNRKAGFRFVYVMVLGTLIPMPTVEVDAIDGQVLLWQSFPR